MFHPLASPWKARHLSTTEAPLNWSAAARRAPSHGTPLYHPVVDDHDKTYWKLWWRLGISYVCILPGIWDTDRNGLISLEAVETANHMQPVGRLNMFKTCPVRGPWFGCEAQDQNGEKVSVHQDMLWSLIHGSYGSKIRNEVGGFQQINLWVPFSQWSSLCSQMHSSGIETCCSIIIRTHSQQVR